MKKLKGLLVMFLVVGLLGGCAADGPEKQSSEDSSNKTTVSAESNTSIAEKTGFQNDDQKITFKDSTGREIEIPANIQRIAPSGGLAQQVLLTIAPDKLVALSTVIKGKQTEKILGKSSDLPEIGQFYGKGNFNAEALAAANPQLIIDIGEPKKSIKDDMNSITEKTGIPAIFIEMKMENAGEAYRTLGRILSMEEEGNEIGKYCDTVYREIKEGMNTIPENSKVKFAYLVGDNGLNAIAKGSFQGEMMEMLGQNIVEVETPSAKGSGNEISAEQLVAWNPEWIIFGPKSMYQEAEKDPFFSSLQAIKQGKYMEAPNVPYNWVGMPPSVNRFLGMQWLAKTFYPQTFTYDLKERIQQYFKLFYHYDLSDEEFQEITKHSLGGKITE